MNIDKILNIAVVAGEKIMQYYNEDFAVNTKDDKSPVTAADLEANEYIVNELSAETPDIKVISEEENLPAWDQRQSFKTFWLVDPLDGTKEFINKTDEFTVNLGLIEAGKPIGGVVYVPASGELYWAFNNKAWKRYNQQSTQIQTKTWQPAEIVMLLSRSHQSDEIQSLSTHYPTKSLQPMGSSLKYVRIAEGYADLAVRTQPTSEWDTAAAQAILEAAGGGVRTLDGEPLRYNKKSIRNPGFIAFGDTDAPWKNILTLLNS